MKSSSTHPAPASGPGLVRSNRTAAAWLAAVILCCVSAQAATTYTWVNDAGGEYGISASWNPNTSVPGTTPTAGDIAQIGVSGHLTPGAVLYDQPGYNYGIANLNIGQAANSTASFTLSDGTLGITNTAGNVFIVGGANPSTGTFTMNGGTLNCLRQDGLTFYKDFLIIGNANNGNGTFTLNGGTVDMLGGVEIGNFACSGTLTVNGGTFIDNGWFGLGRGGSGRGQGFFNLTGGTVYLLRNPGTEGGTSGMSFCQGATNAEAHISGGTLYVNRIGFAATASAGQTDTELLEVSGGNIYLGAGGVVNSGGAGTHTITVNLSGGTFHTANMGPNTGGTQGTNSITFTGPLAGADWTWSSAIPANLTTSPGPGTVTFAPETNRTITLNAAFSGAGGLAMTGPGTLAINGANGYSGTTTISGGTVSGTGSVLGDVSVSASATIAPGTPISAGTLVLGNNLSLNACTNIIKLSGDPVTVGDGVNDLLATSGNLNLSGVSTIKIVPLAPLSTSGDYTVIEYGGSTPLTDFSHLRVISDSARYSFSLAGAYPVINVHVSGNAATLVWKGGAAPSPNNWDHTTLNWSNTTSTASDVFYNGDAVVFDDTANVSAVTVVGSQAPGSIMMANNPLAFTFNGDGPLGGPLDVEGANGLTTIATTNAPLFTSITLNNGTLRFNLANGGLNTVGCVISDNGAGNGTLVQAGTNTLLLSGDNSSPGFNGTIVVTNGLLQYNDAKALGYYTSPLYATNGGSLDLGGVQSLLKNIIISGDGFNGQGALVNNGPGFGNQGIQSLTLAGDASVGGTNRFDVWGGGAGGGSCAGNGFKVTKVGPNVVLFNAIGATAVGDIHVVAGRLGFQGPVDMGDPTKTITVESNAILTFFSTTNVSNPNGNEDKVMVLNGNAIVDSGGVSNNFQGPITLVGTNNLFDLRSTLHLWGSISGSGGLAAGDGPVGTGNGTALWLDAANSYSGATVISNNHKIVLGASATLANTTPIMVGSGGTLDVSRPSSFTLGSGRVVMGAGTITGGNVVFGSGSTLEPGFPDGNTYALTNTGNLTLNSGSTNLVAVKKTTSVANSTVSGPTLVTINPGATLVINNIGSTLAANDAIQVFTATAYSGTFGTIIPATPGPGLEWSQKTLDTDGKLRVVAIAQPDVTSVTVNSGSVVLSGTNGTANAFYNVVTNANVAAPLNQWHTIGTGQFDGNGHFSFSTAILPGQSALYYRVQLQ